MALVEFQPDTIELLAAEADVDLATAEKALNEAHKKYPYIDEGDDDFDKEFCALYEEARCMLME